MIDAIENAVLPSAAFVPDESQPGLAELSPPDRSVDASRSAVYALILSMIEAAAGLDSAVFINLGLIWLAVLLVARRIAMPSFLPAMRLSAIGLIAACMGALPFYVAFLMPDILAPVMILMLALIITYLPHMERGELAVCGLLLLVAIVAHPSHLLIAAAMLPIGLLVSPGMRHRRLWVSVGLIGLLVGVGLSEKVLFGAAAAYFEKKETRFLPFITARLIADGPGMAYLQSHCPDRKLATCALFDQLSQPNTPLKLDAPSILFSTREETGSYKLLSDQQQSAISQEQPDFVLNVIRSEPLAVIGALARNTVVQLSYFRIDMTVPDHELLAKLNVADRGGNGGLRLGRLVTTGPQRWMAPLARLHGAVYGLSAFAIGWLLLKPGCLKADLRFFMSMVIAGIVVNALVCGGISEPAYRYGARVIFLLPMLAAMLIMGGSCARRAVPLGRKNLH